ncbi:KLHL5, partial [Symbiodinium pilosum]
NLLWSSDLAKPPACLRRPKFRLQGAVRRRDLRLPPRYLGGGLRNAIPTSELWELRVGGPGLRFGRVRWDSDPQLRRGLRQSTEELDADGTSAYTSLVSYGHYQWRESVGAGRHIRDK